MMSKNKQFSSTVDLVRDIFDEEDAGFASELEQQIQNRQLVRLLTTLRNKHGITQADVAREMDCQQSKISKIENSTDNMLTMGELEAYAKAIQCDVVLQFTKRNETSLERIKRYSQLIHRELCRLTELTPHDEKIPRNGTEPAQRTSADSHITLAVDEEFEIITAPADEGSGLQP